MAPEALWICRDWGWRTWLPQGRWRSHRIWGRIPEKWWLRQILEMGVDAGCGVQAATGASVQLLVVVCAVHRS